jgi:hypothetical protein
VTASELSPAGRTCIERWEEDVLYVYDDKMPKRHIDGELPYPEWDGGPVRGTLTIGLGHTNAAARKYLRGCGSRGRGPAAFSTTILAPCKKEVLSLPALGSISTPSLPLLLHQPYWLWLLCNSCGHRVAVALVPYVIRWGADASSDLLREHARCSVCGQRGAT